MTDASRSTAYRDDRAHVFHSWSAQELLDPLVVVGGRGAWIDSEDGDGRRWSTVGVSANIVDASFQALVDAVVWKLIRDGYEGAA